MTAETIGTIIAAAAPPASIATACGIIRLRRAWDRWTLTPYPEVRHRRHARRPPNRPENHPANRRSYQ